MSPLHPSHSRPSSSLSTLSSEDVTEVLQPPVQYQTCNTHTYWRQGVQSSYSEYSPCSQTPRLSPRVSHYSQSPTLTPAQGSHFINDIKKEPEEDVKSWETLSSDSNTVRSPLYSVQGLYEEPTTSKISYDRLHEAFGDVVRVKVENTEGESIQELIQRYVHKKLRQQRRFSTKFQEYITDIDAGPKDLEVAEFFPPTKKRKSVIVRAGDTNTKSELPQDCNEDSAGTMETFSRDGGGGPSTTGNLTDIDTSIGDIIGNIMDAGDLLLNVDINPMNGLYSVEEGRQLTHITDIFTDEWSQINFGPNIVAEYIHFCEYKPEIPPPFWKTVNLTIRERCLAFISCLEELDQVSSQDQVKLFTRNLDSVEMLAYVFSFNRGSAEAELEFLFGTEDMDMWKARPDNVTAVNLSSMVSFMPISEEEKFDLYTNFMKCLMATLKDKSVYVLMLLITVFDGGAEGSAASRLRKNFQTMLSRYLLEKCKASFDEDIMKVYEVMAILPELAKPFRRIKYVSEILKSNSQTFKL